MLPSLSGGTPWPVLRLYATVVALTLTESLVRVVVPPYLDGLGYPVELVGALVSIFAFAALASRLPAGLLYRPGRGRRLLRVAFVLLSLGSLLFALSSELAVLAAARVLGGFGFGLASTAALALIMEMAPPGASHRPVATYATILVVGYGAGLSLGGAIADAAGFQATFVSAAVLGLLGAAGVPRMSSVMRAPQAEAVEGISGWRQALWALTHPGVAGVILAAFVLNYLLSASMAFLPLYALAVGLTLTQVGAVIGLHSLCQIVARPLSGVVARRVGHRRVVSGSIVLLVVAYMSIPAFEAFVALAALFVAVGVLRAAAVVSNTVAMAEDVPRGRMSRGAASGFYNAAKDIGDIAGPFISGLVAAQVGLATLFLVVPPSMLMLYALALLAVRRLGKAEVT